MEDKFSAMASPKASPQPCNPGLYGTVKFEMIWNFKKPGVEGELLILRWIVIQGLYSQSQNCLEIEIQTWTLEFIGYFRWEASKGPLESMSRNDQDLSEGVVVVMECPGMTSPRFIGEEKAITFALPML